MRGRGAGTRHCEACDASWARNARFCGGCGAALTLVDRVEPDDPAAAQRRSRVLWAGLVLVGAVLVFAVGPSVVSPLTSPDPDPDVALPTSDAVRPGLTGEERDEALAPFDPRRLSCSPAGCEAWRRPADAHVAGVLPGPSSLVYVDGPDLFSLDVSTGEEVWRLPLAPELGDLDLLGTSHLTIGGAADLVAVATERGAQLVTRDGEQLWATSHDMPGAAWFVLVNEHAIGVLHEPPHRSANPGGGMGEDAEPGDDDAAVEEWGPLQSLTVLDAATGEVAWTRTDVRNLTPSQGADDAIAVTVEDGVRLLDVRTGEVRLALDGEPGWVQWIGNLLAIVSAGDDGDMQTQIVDSTDGTTVLELAGGVNTLRPLGDLDLLVRETGWTDQPDRPDGVAREVIALDAQATIQWRHELPAAPGDHCCPTMIDLGDGRLRLSVGAGTPALVVESATGEVLGDDPLPQLAEGEPRMLWQLDRHTVLQRGEQESSLHDHTGRVVRLRGQVWPLWMSDADGSPRDVYVLDGEREFVGVRFP